MSAMTFRLLNLLRTHPMGVGKRSDEPMLAQSAEDFSIPRELSPKRVYGKLAGNNLPQIDFHSAANLDLHVVSRALALQLGGIPENPCLKMLVTLELESQATAGEIEVQFHAVHPRGPKVFNRRFNKDQREQFAEECLTVACFGLVVHSVMMSWVGAQRPLTPERIREASRLNVAQRLSGSVCGRTSLERGRYDWIFRSRSVGPGELVSPRHLLPRFRDCTASRGTEKRNPTPAGFPLSRSLNHIVYLTKVREDEEIKSAWLSRSKEKNPPPFRASGQRVFAGSPFLWDQQSRCLTPSSSASAQPAPLK